MPDPTVPALRRALPALLLVLGAVLLGYRITVASMVSIWSRSDTFAHAFLVLPLVLWLVWRQRHALASIKPQPCPWMLLPMAGIAFVWLLGDLASINSVTQLAMTALLVLAVPAVLGLRAASALMFPLGFLFFAVPIGEFLLPQLMSWTADFTVLALRASGIPVYREGMRLVIPSGTWSVVEACSGVRYLMASLMVGTLFAYLNYRTARRRWTFVAVAIAVPIVANWVRAYLIVLLGHLSDNKLAAGVDHVVYGWLFFGLVIGLMFAIGSWWGEPPAGLRIEALEAMVEPRHRPLRFGAFWALALGAVAIVLAPHLVLHAIGDVAPGEAPKLAALNTLSSGWQPISRAAVDWKPAFENPIAEANSTYVARGQEVGLYVAYYRQQNYQRKLVSSENELVKSKDPVWSRDGGVGSDTLEIDGGALSVRSVGMRGKSIQGEPEQRLRVWQFYWVGGKLTSSDYEAKVHAAVDRLLGHGDDAAAIVLYAIEDQPGGARAALEAFARANLGAIVAQLRSARDAARATVAVNDTRN
jgi:exosortase A